MKVLVGAFNQEKALVGAFSVIVKSLPTFAASCVPLYLWRSPPRSLVRSSRISCVCPRCPLALLLSSPSLPRHLALLQVILGRNVYCFSVMSFAFGREGKNLHFMLVSKLSWNPKNMFSKKVTLWRECIHLIKNKSFNSACLQCMLTMHVTVYS